MKLILALLAWAAIAAAQNPVVVPAGQSQTIVIQNAQGPKGDKGDPGAKGDKGDTGGTGTVGYYVSPVIAFGAAMPTILKPGSCGGVPMLFILWDQAETISMYVCKDGVYKSATLTDIQLK